MFYHTSMSVLTHSLTHRGHMGGLLGGALAAYLLGPNFVMGTVKTRNGKQGKVLMDKPPIPWLALKPQLL